MDLVISVGQLRCCALQLYSCKDRLEPLGFLRGDMVLCARLFHTRQIGTLSQMDSIDTYRENLDSAQRNDDNHRFCMIIMYLHPRTELLLAEGANLSQTAFV